MEWPHRADRYIANQKRPPNYPEDFFGRIPLPTQANATRARGNAAAPPQRRGADGSDSLCRLSVPSALLR